MKQYEVLVMVQARIPTSAVDPSGASDLAQHAAELAFANIKPKDLYTEVIDVREA